jgi:predicted flap endonuclease-1-like 5' DNA nuclease
MLLRRCAAILLLAAALGSPSAAFAQNAGDDQYSDPLADEPTTQTTPSPQPSDTGTPDQQVSAESAPVETTSAQDTAAPTELARTGVDLRLITGMGLLLLVAGLGLRRAGHGRR